MSSERTGHHGPQSFAGQVTDSSHTRPSWFIPEVTSIPPAGRTLLENYAKIPPEQVLPHVQRIRDRAFALWQCACIGQVRFLDYSIPRYPYYADVLERLRAGGATFLDAGCCFGQEIRFLIHHDGIPAQQLYGFDLEPAFVEMGHALFCDGDGRLAPTMVSGDLLAEREGNGGGEEQGGLIALEGAMDVVHVASVLHSWDWDEMVQAAKRLVQLTRPQAGSLIIGNQMGSLNAGQYPMPTGKGVNFRHNIESFDRFWAQVGKETGTKWKVQSGMVETEATRDNRAASFAKADPEMRMIWFKAERT